MKKSFLLIIPFLLIEVTTFAAINNKAFINKNDEFQYLLSQENTISFDEFEKNLYLIDKLIEEKKYIEADKIILNLLDNKELLEKISYLDFAYLLERFGDVSHHLEQFDNAEKSYKSAKKLYIKVLDNNEPFLGLFFLKLAENYGYYDYPIKALEELENASKVFEESFGKNNIYRNYIKYLYAVNKSELGESFEAEKILKKLELEFDRNKDYKLTKDLIFNQLAIIYSERGDFLNQKKYLYLVKEIFKNEDYRGINYATNLNNIAIMYSDLGDYKNAIDYQLKAKEIYLKLSKFKMAATSFNNLGTFYRYLDQPKYKKENLDLAIKFYKESIDLYEQILGENKNNLSLVNGYINLGEFLIATNKLEEGKLIIEKALDILNSFDINTKEKSRALSYLGDYYFRKKRYKIAEKYIKESLSSFKNIDEIKPIDKANNLISLSEVYYKLNKFRKADKFWEEANKIRIVQIQEQAPFIPLFDRIPFVKKFGYFEPHPGMSFEKRNSAISANYLIHLNYHGILEEIERRQALITSNKLNIELKEKIDLYKQLITNRNIKKSDLENYLALLKKTEEELFMREPELKAKLVNIEEIREVMPNNSSLVEFLKIPAVLNSDGEVIFNSYYVSFILNSNGNLNIFNHDQSSLIDKKINDALLSTKANNQNLSKLEIENLWSEVFKLVITPLNKFIDKSEIIFISPDSMLNLVPFQALKNVNDDNYFVDKYQVKLITSGRDLLKLKEPFSSSNNNSLIIANPKFNLNQRLSSIPMNKVLEPFSELRSIDKKKYNFSNLKETQEEGKKISKIIEGNLLVKDKASTNNVLNYKKPKILHFATHSVYESKNLDSYLTPLINSGIALAGANNKGNFLDDGFLSALEFTKLDLRDTELVVVSGCESGVGISDIRGESVYGLKRSIVVSGARSSILTLWPVDDKATRAFMIDFYQRLKKGESRYEALINTQKDFRSGIISSEEGMEDWSDIFYWGAFQLNGDWRSIDFS